MKTQEKSLSVLRNATFKKPKLRFVRKAALCYELLCDGVQAGLLTGNRRTNYWTYTPTRLIPRAPRLHCPQVMQGLDAIKAQILNLL